MVLIGQFFEKILDWKKLLDFSGGSLKSIGGGGRLEVGGGGCGGGCITSS